jgi:predicted CXXCH cytochrome family protein
MRPLTRLLFASALATLVAFALHINSSFAGHPVGDIDPKAAASIGQPKLKVVECLDCHDAHGAVDSGLLQGWEHGEAACTRCHTGLEPETHAGGHPLDHVVTRRMAAALREAGGVLGSNNTLTCESCHTTHGEVSMAPRCLACHEEQAIVADVTATGHRSGACTNCHNADMTERKAELGRVPGDSSGCLSCHGEGSKYQSVDAHPGQVGHALVDREGGFGPSDPPLEGCTSCHGGHDVVRPDSMLCEGCHDEQAEDHARGGHGSATCIDCHPPHQERPMHADATEGEPLNPVSLRCLACHAEDAPVELTDKRVESYDHPAPVFHPGGARWTPLGNLPLFDEAGRVLPARENGDLTCATCHLSHGPDHIKEGDHLRRAGWEPVCSACHDDEGLMYYRWFHYRERLHR